MRFILKSAFWLGLVAFMLPSDGEKSLSSEISTWGVFLGAQQALADMAGFCDRAPQACAAGQDLAVFAGERIGDGLTLAYRLAEERLTATDPQVAEVSLAEPAAPGAEAPEMDMASRSAPDPIQTGAVDAGSRQATVPAH